MRKAGVFAALVVAVTLVAAPVSANNYQWPTVNVGQTKAIPSPVPCTGSWQMDFGAQYLSIVHGEPTAVTVRGNAISPGPVKLKCGTQSLWVQVLAAPPEAVVPEAPLVVLLPLTCACLLGMGWFARRRLLTR